MSDRQPRVTVGVPVYNGEQFIGAALNSLMAQEYADLEILISDNASTDATEEICRAAEAADKRVSYHRNPVNIGGNRNLNRLVDLARGEMFKWAYYDDECRPTLVSQCVKALDEAGPSAVLSYPRVLIINSDGEVTGAYDDADLGLDADEPDVRLGRLLSKIVAQTQFGLIRTDVLRQTNLSSGEIGGEFVLPAELALRGKMVVVDDQLQLMRTHAAQHGGNRETELRWIDPTGKKRTLFPYSRSSALILSAIANAPLTSAQRRRCIVALVRNWTIPQWRYMASDIKHLPEDLTHHWRS